MSSSALENDHLSGRQRVHVKKWVHLHLRRRAISVTSLLDGSAGWHSVLRIQSQTWRKSASDLLLCRRGVYCRSGPCPVCPCRICSFLHRVSIHLQLSQILASTHVTQPCPLLERSPSPSSVCRVALQAHHWPSLTARFAFSWNAEAPRCRCPTVPWWWWWWHSKKSVQQLIEAWPYKRECRGHNPAKKIC